MTLIEHQDGGHGDVITSAYTAFDRYPVGQADLISTLPCFTLSPCEPNVAMHSGMRLKICPVSLPFNSFDVVGAKLIEHLQKVGFV